jgi:hypothetical protein
MFSRLTIAAISRISAPGSESSDRRSAPCLAHQKKALAGAAGAPHWATLQARIGIPLKFA